MNRRGSTWFSRMFAAMALGALCACGGGGSSATTDAPDVASPDVGTETAPPAAEFLTVDDLPEGWYEVPAGDSTTGGDSCLDMLAAPGGPFDPTAAQSVTFAAGDIGPFLGASVVERPAEQVLPAVDDILVTCNERTSASGFTTTVEPAPIDNLPPNALAVRGSDVTEDGSGVRYVLAAAGTDAATVMVVGVTPLGDVDEALVAEALNTAYARLPTS